MARTVHCVGPDVRLRFASLTFLHCFSIQAVCEGLLLRTAVLEAFEPGSHGACPRPHEHAPLVDGMLPGHRAPERKSGRSKPHKSKFCFDFQTLPHLHPTASPLPESPSFDPLAHITAQPHPSCLHHSSKESVHLSLIPSPQPQCGRAYWTTGQLEGTWG